MYTQTTWLAKILNTINGMFPESDFLVIWSNRDEDLFCGHEAIAETFEAPVDRKTHGWKPWN